MTLAGGVYERVMGKTVRLTDPIELTRLLERGRSARSRAEHAVETAEQDNNLRGPARDNATLHTFVTLCATGYADEEPSPFTEATKEALRAAVGALRPNPLTEPRPIHTLVSQTELLLSLHGEQGPHFVDGVGHPDRAWRAEIGVNGAVAVRCGGDDGALEIAELFEDVVLPAWQVAAECVELIGGYGPTRVSVAVGGSFNLTADEYGHAADFGGLQHTRAWIDGPQPDDETVQRMQRDLLRARGVQAWEP
jgi:hypothetical protein